MALLDVLTVDEESVVPEITPELLTLPVFDVSTVLVTAPDSVTVVVTVLLTNSCEDANVTDGI